MPRPEGAPPSAFNLFRLDIPAAILNTDYHKQSTDKHNIVKIRA